MRLWGLVNLKSEVQAGMLEIHVRVDIAILSPKSAGWKIKQGFMLQS